MRWSEIKDRALETGNNGTPDSYGRVRTTCPFCLDRKGTPDRKESFLFYLQSTFFKCFRCGIKGVAKSDGQDYTPVTAGESFEHRNGPDGFEELRATTNQAAGFAKSYLMSRGFSETDIYRAGIGVCSFGEWAGRIIIPHKDEHNVWWGWSGRTWVNDDRLRYRYPKHMSRSRMYNDQALQIASDEPVLVVEGALDAVRYLPNAVACLGQPTEDHVSRLLAAKRPIAMCLDSDKEQVSRGLAIYLHRRGARVGYIHIPPGRDPGDLDSSVLESLAQKCIGGKIKYGY